MENLSDRIVNYVWNNFTFFLILIMLVLYVCAWNIKSATLTELIILSLLYTAVIGVNVYNYISLKLWTKLKEW